MSRTYHKLRISKYQGSKKFDSSCRNHGSCGWCEGNRTFFDKKARQAADNELELYRKFGVRL